MAHLQVGGKESGLVNLVNRLDPELFENYIFTHGQDGFWANRIVPGRCRIIEFDDAPKGNYRRVFRLAQAFRQFGIHVVHTHSWATLIEGVMGAKLARVPIIIHGEYGTIKAETQWHIHLQRRFWRVTDQVLSASQALREKLSTLLGFPEARIRVIANGVDLTHFSALRNGVDYKWRLGLPPEALVLGTIGRLVPPKAYPVLFKASKLIFNQVPYAYLIIVGEGPLRQELVQMAQEYNMIHRIRFLGIREDVSDILKAFDMYVTASEREGMSNSILEAMASGLPVVATAIGGNPELVVNDETGLLVPPNHPRALAAALLRLIEAPTRRQSMGQFGRQRVENSFDLRHTVQHYTNLYTEIFKQRFKLNERLRAVLREKVHANLVL